eukprot:5444010-Amphidinium_carterae.1
MAAMTRMKELCRYPMAMRTMELTKQVSKEMVSDALNFAKPWSGKISATLEAHSPTNFGWLLQMRGTS